MVGGPRAALVSCGLLGAKRFTPDAASLHRTSSSSARLVMKAAVKPISALAFSKRINRLRVRAWKACCAFEIDCLKDFDDLLGKDSSRISNAQFSICEL